MISSHLILLPLILSLSTILSSYLSFDLVLHSESLLMMALSSKQGIVKEIINLSFDLAHTIRVAKAIMC